MPIFLTKKMRIFLQKMNNFQKKINLKGYTVHKQKQNYTKIYKFFGYTCV